MLRLDLGFGVRVASLGNLHNPQLHLSSSANRAPSQIELSNGQAGVEIDIGRFRVVQIPSQKHVEMRQCACEKKSEEPSTSSCFGRTTPVRQVSMDFGLWAHLAL